MRSSPSLLVIAVFSLAAGAVRDMAALDGQQQTSQRTPATVLAAEATELTNGWALLTEGKPDQALARADRALTINPRSVGALVLGIEAEIARSRGSGALARYEQWISARPFEEPSVLRLVATGVLREQTAAGVPPSVRFEALSALGRDGDPTAVASLEQGLKTASLGEARTLARMGHEKAVRVLIDDLKQTAGRSPSGLEALGESGSRLAMEAVSEQLTHGLPEVRAAAAEALGKLGKRFDVVKRLKPLLSDETPYVRYKAAAALFGLGDMSGLKILQDLATHENPKSRLMAAQAMASQSGPEWQHVVQQLLSAEEPEVRVEAARLLLPHQPEAARRVLEGAMADQNSAIRAMASDAYVEWVPASDLRALRQMLKAADLLVRIHASERILELTR